MQRVLFNSAPADQQLDQYPAGAEVRLSYLTERVREWFVLPALEVPVTVVDRSAVATNVTALPDTIAIYPGRRQVTIVARATFEPTPDVTGLRAVVVGRCTRGEIRALLQGKRYLGPRRRTEATGRSS